MKQSKVLLLIITISVFYSPLYAQWNVIQTPFTQPVRDIYFTSENTGYGITNHGYVMKTTNGGGNWTSQNINPSALNRIQFINSNTGYIAGYGVNVYKTTNGGTNWAA